jgi:manganese transport system substrate-binding protein
MGRWLGARLPPKHGRRLLSVFALQLALLLSACASDRSGGLPAGLPADRRPLVLASFSVIADMAREVSCGRLRTASITRLGAPIHGYEVSPGDLRRARGARLLLENGLGLDPWLQRFAVSLGSLPRVNLSRGITPIPIGSDDRRPNPHAWLSPRASLIYVRNLEQAFSRLDPAGAASYRRCGSAYAAKLREQDRRLRADLALLPPRSRWLVSCEGAFAYLARDLGLRQAWLWPVNGEREVTPRRLQAVIRLVRSQRVPAVFCEYGVDSGVMRRVAADAPARFAGSFVVDSLSGPGGPAPTSLRLLEHNLALLRSGLRAP